MTAFFDIETGPLPDEQLQLVKPQFTAPANYKDPAKIAASIAEQEAAWKNRAALDATTGQLLCIGIYGQGFASNVGDECNLLEWFWTWLTDQFVLQRSVAGFCIFQFDLPFLMRRSWINGVKVPELLRGRYWHEQLIDIADIWQCGNRDQRVSLDVLSRSLGIGAKNGSGADFATLWREDKKKALAYLENDLELTRLCYQRIRRQ